MGGSIVFQDIEQFAYHWVGFDASGAIVGGYAPSGVACRIRADAAGVTVGDRSRFQVYQTPQSMRLIAQRAESARLRMILTMIDDDQHEPVVAMGGW